MVDNNNKTKMMKSQEELFNIISEMDVPNMRRDLSKVTEALTIIKVLMRKERKVMFPKGSDAI